MGLSGRSAQGGRMMVCRFTRSVKREPLRPTFATRQSKTEAGGGSTTGLLRGEEQWNTDPLLTFKRLRI
jgi:hypothetical protein